MVQDAGFGAGFGTVGVELSDDCNMYFSGTDLRDFYYCFRVTAARGYRNAINFPMTPMQASTFQCFGPHLWQHEKLYPCLSTLAMGDCQAVEIGQKVHVKMGLISRAFSPHEMLVMHGREPRGNISAGIVIDDVLIAEQRRKDSGPHGMADGEARLAKLLEEYTQRGLNAHPDKTFKDVARTSIWGASVDGESGIIRPSPHRLVPLMDLTCRVARLGYASIALLEILAGSWVAILQIRRRMLCLLEAIYAVQRGKNRHDIVKLPPSLCEELWVLVILGPVATCSMRWQTHDELFLSDASDDCKASVRCNVGGVFCRELRRHSLSRGAWSKLLSPWKSWLRNHEALFAEDELPAGVPLVSHPLWTVLARSLQFVLNHRNPSRSRKHINLLELSAILEVEQRLAQRFFDRRYLLGADSQVALAAVVKGRSSSPRLNGLLQKSLATLLGAGLHGEYGYLPSLVNVSDDPTRNKSVREPDIPMPDWLRDALQGQFAGLDEWLRAVGYDPLHVAGIPGVDSDFHPDAVAVDQFLSELRSVQKPDRLARFDQRVSELPSRRDVSHLSFETKNGSRGHEEEPDGQTKTVEKRQKDQESKRDSYEPIDHFVALDQAAPPEELSKVFARPEVAENESYALLTEEQLALVRTIPAEQFIAPSGRRAHGGLRPARRFFLDLYSGRAGVARQIAKQGNVFVLTFDFERGSEQDLLKPEVQTLIMRLLKLDCIAGCGLAPECCSFSRAVCPPVRSRDFPEGLPGISDNMKVKVHRGNLHAAFCLRILRHCIAYNILYWLENPDGSFLWLLDTWIRSGVCEYSRAFRFDMCVFKTPWRKRTRILTNTCLAGKRWLCSGDHSHIQLRGRSKVHGRSWTHAAQVYPLRLCKVVAKAMLAQVAGATVKQEKLSMAACAHCNSVVGEAKNPGPRRPNEERRDPSVLVNTRLVEPVTQRLQDRIWQTFINWLLTKLSEQAVEQIFVCPTLAVEILKQYGIHLYAEGRGLYELRHLLVLAQQRHPPLRAVMAPAWGLVSMWEEQHPVRHRQPLHEILFRAMFSAAVLKGWLRFAATLLLGIEGIARIGELLRATRGDLVLPLDMFDVSTAAAFLRVNRPKTLRRGKGRIQHLKVENHLAISFLQYVFGPLSDFLPLFPLSASAFRNRWDKLLSALRVPLHLRPKPGGIRGGGAILAYKRGESIQNILWRMRILSQSTLESYLQELAADSPLTQLPEVSKVRIRKFSSLYQFCLVARPSASHGRARS